uniref:RAC-like GTP binding protein RHO1 n=1 Tax=Rhizophora mucronata TaxID=61149 RepID=A0A2P2IHP4_RHIMU
MQPSELSFNLLSRRKRRAKHKRPVQYCDWIKRRS